MSQLAQRTITCPGCARSFAARLADSINGGRAPAARAKILADEFHSFTCPHCDGRVAVEARFLYSDWDRRHFIQVFMPEDLAQWPECETITMRTLLEGFEQAPPAYAAVPQQFTVRTVFGRAAVADKL